MTINLPATRNDSRYVRYNTGIWGNVVYAVPPESINGIPRINALDDIYGTPGSGEGEYILNHEDELLYNSLTAQAWDQTADLYNLDTWEYIRASDVARQAMYRALYMTIHNLLTYNSWKNDCLKSAFRITLKLFRYVDHVITAEDWNIQRCYREVLLPPVFQSEDDCANIQSTFLDMSDCPQSGKFSQFSMREGVILDETKTINYEAIQRN